MSEVEFKVEPKKLKLTAGGKTELGRFPFNGERRRFQDKLEAIQKEGATGEAGKVIDEFLMSLGFSQEIIDELDSDNYSQFLIVALGGKKN